MEVIFLNSNSLTENVEPIVKCFEKRGSQLSWPEIPHAINSQREDSYNPFNLLSEDHIHMTSKLFFWNWYNFEVL